MNREIVIRNETDADIDAIAEVTIEGLPSEVFFALSFNGRKPHGTVTFHEGFKVHGQQPPERDK